MRFHSLLLIAALSLPAIAHSQPEKTPYGGTTPTQVKEVMDRVMKYMDSSTPFGLIGVDGKPTANTKKPERGTTLVPSTYGLTTHEWGLAYSSMLLASETTGDSRFLDYVKERFEFIAIAAPYFRAYKNAFPEETNPMERFLFPHLLDDTGSMCAAMIQGINKGLAPALRQEIDRSVDYIMNKEHRLENGTFARHRPMPNSVWVDDLYQGIPALAYMGNLTGERKYFDEATKQVLLFRDLLFDPALQVCMHGWVEGMEPHPAFYWGRANGWAIMAIAALLGVLPEDHPHHKSVLEFFKDYCHGLSRLQSSTGFWHQLMDRNDSFLETSATAMFTYVFAHGVNQGWLDIKAYGPKALLGWNAVSTKVNAQGQVEGTSAGTSMAFDAAFYYQRPVGTGPHGYGSVMLAGAAMYKMLAEHTYTGGNGPILFVR